MLSDVRYALRMLIKAPGFTAVALLTLALGIGANTAIFTLVNATLLRQLPVGDPSQLVLLTDPGFTGMNFGAGGGDRPALAYSEYTALRDNNRVFSGLLAAQAGSDRNRITWDAGVERAQTKLVSNNYFAVLEIPAYRGRLFDPNQPLKPGGEPYAVLSYAYWQQRFGGSAAVLGRTLQAHHQVFTVIGITPPGFSGENVGSAPDIFFPIAMWAQVAPGGPDRLHDPPGMSRVMWLQAMGRLKPGVTLQQAQTACNVIFKQSVELQAAGAPDAAGRRNLMDQQLKLSGGAHGTSGLRGQFGDPLLAVFGLVGLVLVLAIINLASLLLARATARQKEMGVRLALGAGRGRVIRQLLMESVVLAVAGGLIGFLLAIWGDRLLLALVSAGGGPAITLNLTPDARVVAFAAAICLGSGLLFGLAPALRMSRLDLNATLQATGRGGSGRTRHVLGQWIRGGLPLGKLLVIGQVAISIVLLVGAGLFVHSLQKLGEVPLGFNPSQLTQFGVDAGGSGYKGEAAGAMFRKLLAQIAAVPGVQKVGLADNGILNHSDCGLPLSVAGYTPPNGRRSFGARCDSIAGDFFGAAGIPIVLGRPLTPQDDTGPRNVVINQTFAHQVFAHRSPIGQHLHDMYPDDKGAVYTVVGVAADSIHNSLAEKPAPRFYMDFFNGIPQDPDNQFSFGNLLVRGAPGTGALRAAVRAVDPNLITSDFGSMSATIKDSLASQQLLAKLSGFFGILALLMAAIGLYGVMSYGVARRTPEIGVRMALGAAQGTVVGMILGETAVLAVIGVVIGLPASVAGAKFIANKIHLFGLQYYDPVALGTAVLILAAAALLAGFIPAQRASRVDPLRALREE